MKKAQILDEKHYMFFNPPHLSFFFAHESHVTNHHESQLVILFFL